MNKVLYLIFIFFISYSYSIENIDSNKPKIVIAIVVDQMRFDYIYRFWNDFGDNGFKKLIKEGYLFRNTHYNYAPTYTGPGHASIFTGTTPSIHGIIANNWFDKNSGNTVYCAGDTTTMTICDCNLKKDMTDDEGKMSPHRLLTTTFCDLASTISSEKFFDL